MKLKEECVGCIYMKPVPPVYSDTSGNQKYCHITTCMHNIYYVPDITGAKISYKTTKSST